MGNVMRLLLWVILLLALAAPVMAQGLEKIVVTARRREARGYDEDVPPRGRGRFRSAGGRSPARSASESADTG
jgi:hypothetical protein